MMPPNLEVCAGCGHIRAHHDERPVIGAPVACPLPCECVGFVEPVCTCPPPTIVDGWSVITFSQFCPCHRQYVQGVQELNA